MAQANSYVGVMPTEKKQSRDVGTRLGEREKEMLVTLYKAGINTYTGIPVHKFLLMFRATNYYYTVLFERLVRLAKKNLVTLEQKGFYGGLVVFFTRDGLKLSRKLAKKLSKT